MIILGCFGGTPIFGNTHIVMRQFAMPPSSSKKLCRWHSFFSAESYIFIIHCCHLVWKWSLCHCGLSMGILSNSSPPRARLLKQEAGMLCAEVESGKQGWLVFELTRWKTRNGRCLLRFNSCRSSQQECQTGRLQWHLQMKYLPIIYLNQWHSLPGWSRMKLRQYVTLRIWCDLYIIISYDIKYFIMKCIVLSLPQ